MLRWLALAVVLCCFSSSSENLQARPLFGMLKEDKAAHASFAAAAQVGCSAITTTFTERMAGTIGCFALINALGVIKEATDPAHHGTRDIKDIYANIIGSGISFIAIEANF